MTTDTIMRDILRQIREATAGLDTDAYCWLLRELGEWCEIQAELQEYVIDADLTDEEND